MVDIKVTRDKQYLYFKKDDEIDCVRYDLKTLVMQRIKEYKFREPAWINVNRAYDYFKGFHINDLKYNDEKFIQLIRDAREINDNCKSLSTFISRLNDSLVGEEYLANGINYEHSSSYEYNSWSGRRRHGMSGRTRNKKVITKPLSFYDKHFVKIFQDAGFMVSVDFENEYIENKDMYDKIANIISTMNLESEQLQTILNQLGSRGRKDLLILIKDYKYDVRSLLNYIFNYLQPFENVLPHESINLLTDYYRMASIIGRDVKRYPKYLKSIHDIIVANYNAHKQKYDEIKFERLMKPELEYEGKVYCIIVPHQSKDVIAEGTDLNHCVSSYVNKILKEETYIMFMRMKETKEKSLITIELKEGAITQAKGHSNRALQKDEREFLEGYCEKKKIELKVE